MPVTNDGTSAWLLVDTHIIWKKDITEALQQYTESIIVLYSKDITNLTGVSSQQATRVESCTIGSEKIGFYLVRTS